MGSIHNNSKKLVMTLLVRDEADIIRHNIEFHLNHGVDYIIATDNGSIDGTIEILEEYKQKGNLHLILEPQQNYAQAHWVNRMAEIAHKKFNAEYMIHCDADEFWFPRSGNLKNEISTTANNVLSVPFVNVLLADRSKQESFPGDAIYAVVKPFTTSDLEIDSLRENLYLFKYPQKVIFRTTDGLFEVLAGNHDVVDNGFMKKGLSRDITIYHFPIRSYQHFTQKVIYGGSSCDRNQKLSQRICFHWRRWYESYKKGTLDQEYDLLILREDRAAQLIMEGIVSKFSFSDLTSANETWAYHSPVFEYETFFNDITYAWAGHKCFAYDLVRNIKPQRIVELGTYKGTSFFSFCQAVKDGFLDTELYAIDTWQGDKHSGFYESDILDGVRKIVNSCYSGLNCKLIQKTFDDAVSQFEDNSIDILHIDGLHTYDAVKHDYDTWSKKVKSDGIILLHDTAVYERDFGVFRLLSELRKEYEVVDFLQSYGLGILLKRANHLLRRDQIDFMRVHYLREYEKRMISAVDELDVKTKQLETEIENMKNTRTWKMRCNILKLLSRAKRQ